MVIQMKSQIIENMNLEIHQLQLENAQLKEHFLFYERESNNFCDFYINSITQNRIYGNHGH
jgi:hypothetical protein